MQLPGLENYSPTPEEMELIQLMRQPASAETMASRASRDRERWAHFSAVLAKYGSAGADWARY